MYESRRLRPAEQAEAVAALGRLRQRRGQVDVDLAAAVGAARDAGLPDEFIGEVLGVHRNTVRARYGPVNGPRGRLVEAVHLQTFEVPAPRQPAAAAVPS